MLIIKKYNMKNIGIIVISLLSLFGFMSCGNNGGNIGLVSNHTPSEFKAAIAKSGATLVDIRTPEEYKEGHLEGAIMINWKKRTFRNYVLNLPQDKPILIYCRSGNRSGKAASALQALGFSDIVNLDKGIKEWKKEGMNVVTVDTKANIDFQVKAKNTTNDVEAAIKKMAAKGLGQILDVSSADFKAAINKDGATIVDVRTEKEFNESHIDGAIMIDWKKRTFKDLMSKIDKNKPVLIYCRSGNRSGKAASTMQAMGFKKVLNLKGGIKDWKKHNLPLTK